MVNAAQLEEPIFDIDLGVFAGDPDAERAVAVFVNSLRGSTHANNGYGSRFRLILNAGQEKKEVSMQQTTALKPVADGSPRRSYDGDWYDNEDQMSRGGNGSGGNWIA